MRPPDASRDLSTKDQLKENFPHARIISSNSWHALFLCRFRVQCSFSVIGVVFFRTAASISPVLALASCSLLLLLIHRAARSPGRLRASAVSWQRCIAPVSGGSSTCCGCQRGAARDGAVQHRPHHQEPPRGRPLLWTRCSTVAVA